MRRPTLTVTLAVSTLCVLSACGASAARPARQPLASTAPAPVAQPVASEATQMTIARAELYAVLDGGLGRFLARVETEPAREAGHFIGFRIVALESRFASSDATGSGLRAGDVIVRVNGQVIERPEQALGVWEGLRVASTLAIEYLRAGQRCEARFEIVD